MPFNINNFTSQLEYDGARPNLFEVYMAFPAQVLNASAASIKTTFMAKASSLPASTIGVANVSYFGREIKLAGNRTFEDWTITVINDEDFIIRNAFENWMNLINSHEGNLRDPSMVNLLGYSTDPYVLHYGKTGNPIAQYNFIGLWPTNVSAIELDWGNNDEVEQFNVTLAYQEWRKVGVTD